MSQTALPEDRVWELPPLILHPFSDPTGPDKLVESSRAHLMMQGLLPSGGLSPEEIEERLLVGRYCEIRMLFYVGKDLERWVNQCLEIVERDEMLSSRGIRFGSFADFLTDSPPAHIREKLNRWGVVDYRAIFIRALGINALFASVPERETLSPLFLKQYYRFADQLFHSRLQGEPFLHLEPRNFNFELYASGEYSRMLEKEWEES